MDRSELVTARLIKFNWNYVQIKIAIIPVIRGMNKPTPQRIALKEDRLKYWLGVGADPSDRVASFCAKSGLMEPRERREQTKKAMPKAKAQARLKDAQEASKAAAEAAVEAPVEAPAEAPAGEATAG